jgi:hypothetical protein
MSNRLADAAVRTRRAGGVARRDSAVRCRRRLAIGVVLLVAMAVGCTRQPPSITPSGEPSVGVRIPVPRPFRVAAGEGSVWVLSRGPAPCSPPEPCTVSRIDPGSNRPVGTPTRLPADGWDLAVGPTG